MHYDDIFGGFMIARATRKQGRRKGKSDREKRTESAFVGHDPMTISTHRGCDCVVPLFADDGGGDE
jgi:hypothetical protein